MDFILCKEAITVGESIGYAKLKGTFFFGGIDSNLAWSEAQNHAGIHKEDKGFMATLPQLVHGISYDPNKLDEFGSSITPLSEEINGKSPAGINVLIELHGGGIIDPSKNIGSNIKLSVKVYPQNFQQLLDGKLPDGSEIPIFPFKELESGISNLPMKYAVWTDLDRVQNKKSGKYGIEELRTDELFIMRAGGPESANKFLDAIGIYAEAKQLQPHYGNRHSLGKVDENQTQSRLLLLNKGDFGISDSGLHYINFLAISSTQVEDFLQSTGRTTLEDII